MQLEHLSSGMHKVIAHSLRAAGVFFLALMLASCGEGSSNGGLPMLLNSPTPEPVTPTPAASPTPSATPIPPGTAENPIAMGIVFSDSNIQTPPASEFIQYLADTTGYVFKITNFANEMDLLTAMDQGFVSFAWLQPEEYLYASDNDIAQVAFLTSHYGLYGYGSNFYVRSESGYEIGFDMNTGLSTLDEAEALNQFADKTPCLVNERSISGYAYPLGLFAMQGITIKDPVLVQTHESVVRALYTGGICDFGVTYGISGDPRTASSIQKEMPEVMDKVQIAWQSPADIPSLNFSYATSLSGDIRFAITSAVTEFAKTAEGLDTLSKMNQYSIDELRAATDDEYGNLRIVIEASGIPLDTFISR